MSGIRSAIDAALLVQESSTHSTEIDRPSLLDITTTSAVTPRFSGLPKDRPPIRSSREATTNGDGGAFDWESLVPLFIHPLKVAVVEALDWIEQPLSPTELALMFDEKGWTLGIVAYHVNTLLKAGVIEVIGERQARGARESYYYFPQA